jgi:hypothetical protein
MNFIAGKGGGCRVLSSVSRVSGCGEKEKRNGKVKLNIYIV